MKKENLDKLEECIPFQFTPFVDCLNHLDNVYTSCTGSILDPFHDQVIKQFSESFNILHKQFGVTITPKVHIIQDHLIDFFKLNGGVSLKVTTEQLDEACHHFVKKRLNECNYFVKDVGSYKHGEDLLSGMPKCFKEIIFFLHPSILKMEIFKGFFRGWGGGHNCIKYCQNSLIKTM